MCTFVPEEGKKRESRVLRSLFCKFKTLVSFPEAAAFAWLDQADLGLSRRPRPSPLDGSSASHATCSTRGAAPRRTARVPRESTHSPRGSGQCRVPRITGNRWKQKFYLAWICLYFWITMFKWFCAIKLITHKLLVLRNKIYVIYGNRFSAFSSLSHCGDFIIRLVKLNSQLKSKHMLDTWTGWIRLKGICW